MITTMTKKTYNSAMVQVVEIQRNRDIILTSTDPYGMNNALLGEQVDEAW